MNALIDDLKDKIALALADSAVSSLISGIELESDLDEFGEEFLRVIVKLKPTQDDIDSALETALERIEQTIAPIDDRYPSVRFQDAA